MRFICEQSILRMFTFKELNMNLVQSSGIPDGNQYDAISQESILRQLPPEKALYKIYNNESDNSLDHDSKQEIFKIILMAQKKPEYEFLQSDTNKAIWILKFVLLEPRLGQKFINFMNDKNDKFHNNPIVSMKKLMHELENDEDLLKKINDDFAEIAQKYPSQNEQPTSSNNKYLFNTSTTSNENLDLSLHLSNENKPGKEFTTLQERIKKRCESLPIPKNQAKIISQAEKIKADREKMRKELKKEELGFKGKQETRIHGNLQSLSITEQVELQKWHNGVFTPDVQKLIDDIQSKKSRASGQYEYKRLQELERNILEMLVNGKQPVIEHNKYSDHTIFDCPWVDSVIVTGKKLPDVNVKTLKQIFEKIKLESVGTGIFSYSNARAYGKLQILKNLLSQNIFKELCINQQLYNQNDEYYKKGGEKLEKIKQQYIKQEEILLKISQNNVSTMIENNIRTSYVQTTFALLEKIKSSNIAINLTVIIYCTDKNRYFKLKNKQLTEIKLKDAEKPLPLVIYNDDDDKWIDFKFNSLNQYKRCSITDANIDSINNYLDVTDYPMINNPSNIFEEVTINNQHKNQNKHYSSMIQSKQINSGLSNLNNIREESLVNDVLKTLQAKQNNLSEEEKDIYNCIVEAELQITNQNNSLYQSPQKTVYQNELQVSQNYQNDSQQYNQYCNESSVKNKSTHETPMKMTQEKINNLKENKSGTKLLGGGYKRDIKKLPIVTNDEGPTNDEQQSKWDH